MNFSSGALHLALTHFPPLPLAWEGLAGSRRGTQASSQQSGGKVRWMCTVECSTIEGERPLYSSHREQPCCRCVTLERQPPPLSPLSFIHISSYQSLTVCINVFQPGSPSVALHPSVPTGSESHSRWRSENPKAASPKLSVVAQIQF